MTNPRDAQTAPELHCPFCGHAPYTVEESAESFGKRTDRRRNLVKAGALILAEIERLDRTALRALAGDVK